MKTYTLVFIKSLTNILFRKNIYLENYFIEKYKRYLTILFLHDIVYTLFK